MRRHQLDGVTVVDPATTWIDTGVTLGRDVVVRVVCQPRVEDGLHRGMPGEEFGDGRTVLAVALHPQRQRLEPADGQVCVERARYRAGPVLQEREGVVESLVVGHQHAADDIGMSADVLGGRVQHDVGPEQHGLLECR